METPAPIKIVLFGKAAVGKTSLFLWAQHKPFDLHIGSTIPAMFASRGFQVDGKEVFAQIWDTAGQERYASITKGYFQGASGGLAVFDVTDPDTLEAIKDKVKTFKQTARPAAVVVLVGNKTDLPDRRVSEEAGRAAAAELEVLYVETSAKDQASVEVAFTRCISQVAQTFTFRPMSIVLDPSRSQSIKPRAKCC